MYIYENYMEREYDVVELFYSIVVFILKTAVNQHNTNIYYCSHSELLSRIHLVRDAIQRGVLHLLPCSCVD